MTKRYQDYLDSFGLATEPMTYKEFVEYVTEQDAKEEARALKVSTIREEVKNIYSSYIAQGKDLDDEDDAYFLVRKMKRIHDDNCTKAYNEGDKELIGAYNELFEEAKKAIMNPYKYEYIPHNTTATNVYDDDDRPTSY